MIKFKPRQHCRGFFVYHLMQRRKFIQQSAFAMAMLSLYRTDVFANPFRAYNFKPLRNDVGIFTEQGGTIAWLNGGSGFVVVDAQFPNTAPNVIVELKKLGDKPFKYLLNTHHHGDHTGGNIAFKGLAEHVVAHANSLTNQKLNAEKNNSLDKQFLPDQTFGTGWKAPVGKETITASYFGSGHTNGDAVFHFQNANIAHVGDLVFNRRFPAIDKANGAHVGNWIKVLDGILAKYDNDTLFVWGHSLDPEKVTGNKDDIRAFQNFLNKTVEYVSAQIKAGKTIEEIQSTTEIPGAPEWKGNGSARILQATYQELTGAKS